MTSRTPPPRHGTFGQLTIIGDAIPGKLGAYVPCMCSCDTPVFVLWSRLNSGSRTTCATGCKPAFKKERLYNIWTNMKTRCLNSDSPRYRRYGGRGIGVCEEWLTYKPFRHWALASGYGDDLTLERVDNNKGYCAENCAWIPRADQSRNRASCITIELDGEARILTEWAEDPRCVVKYHTLYARIKKGWNLKDAMTLSVNSRKPKASEGVDRG